MNSGTTRTVADDEQARGAWELVLLRQKRLEYERHEPPCEPLYNPPYAMTARICPKCEAKFRAPEYLRGYVLCPRCEQARKGSEG